MSSSRTSKSDTNQMPQSQLSHSLSTCQKWSLWILPICSCDPIIHCTRMALPSIPTPLAPSLTDTHPSWPRLICYILSLSFSTHDSTPLPNRLYLCSTALHTSVIQHPIFSFIVHSFNKFLLRTDKWCMLHFVLGMLWSARKKTLPTTYQGR
jgi:hypothetical protein